MFCKVIVGEFPRGIVVPEAIVKVKGVFNAPGFRLITTGETNVIPGASTDVFPP